MPNRPTIEVTDARTGSLVLTIGVPVGLTVEHCKRLALGMALNRAAEDWDWSANPELDGPPSLSELEVREVGAVLTVEGRAA